MPEQKPLFSQKRLTEIVQSLKERIAEHIRQQKAGILPFYSRMPITIIEARHVEIIIRRGRSTAQKVMKGVREKLNKKPRQRVSISEFCKETEIPIEDVRYALNLMA